MRIAVQRSVELNVAASVDPFAKAYAVINASADSQTGEATMSVEEAALQTTSLPWNLTAQAGRFFAFAVTPRQMVIRPIL